MNSTVEGRGAKKESGLICERETKLTSKRFLSSLSQKIFLSKNKEKKLKILREEENFDAYQQAGLCAYQTLKVAELLSTCT